MKKGAMVVVCGLALVFTVFLLAFFMGRKGVDENTPQPEPLQVAEVETTLVPVFEEEPTQNPEEEEFVQRVRIELAAKGISVVDEDGLRNVCGSLVSEFNSDMASADYFTLDSVTTQLDESTGEVHLGVGGCTAVGWPSDFCTAYIFTPEGDILDSEEYMSLSISLEPEE